MLALWVASPTYFAVMEWRPTDNVDVLNLAVPAERVICPSRVEPSRNWTVPVEAAGFTVAVKVTNVPKVDEMLLEVRLVVVLIVPLTVCTTVFEVLPKLFESPL